MEIVSKTEGSKVTMEITGWLDTQTAPQLEKELSALDPGTTSLVFDFANLEYISSAGLRLVIAAYKKMAGKEGFRIVNVSDNIPRGAFWTKSSQKTRELRRAIMLCMIAAYCCKRSEQQPVWSRPGESTVATRCFL